MSAPESPLAFPRTLDSDEVQFMEPQVGMSLRDWFAGQALPSTLTQGFNIKTSLGDKSAVEWATEIAYRAADRMLSERAKAGQP